MKHFNEYIANHDLLSRLWLIETYFSYDPAQYNKLFDDELKKISVSSPEHQQALEKLRDFKWVGYIAKCLRNAGYRDQREVQERTHDIVVKMLIGGLFRDYDETKHGPLTKRYAAACRNAVRNTVAKDRNGRRLIPTVPIGSTSGVDDVPDRDAAGNKDDEQLISDFRILVRDRLGQLGIAVLDARLQNQETRSLIGRKDLGSPGGYQVKAIVQMVKALTSEYAERIGHSAFLRDVQRAMAREGATVKKRISTTAARKLEKPRIG